MNEEKSEKQINVGGGAYIGGDVSTGGGDFVGRDKVIVSGDRSVAIGGNVSGSVIITGDGNVVGQSRVTGQIGTVVSLIQEIGDTIKDLDIQEDDKEEILLDISRAKQSLVSIPPNPRIAVKRLASLVDFISGIDNLEIQRSVLPNARRALMIAKSTLE